MVKTPPSIAGAEFDSLVGELRSHGPLGCGQIFFFVINKIMSVWVNINFVW